ncbi:hypothetical protein KSZ_65040 [Dictyobacter formicarum]|uniref:Uncharacterized protein n=1 Tax=Dictyobacter formicarum TaxID=2778368 RepID=A0ABQ3VRP0_9CHLR|nr:hypothetical protein KSZ_65040 [Dictyobacter formicarum]
MGRLYSGHTELSDVRSQKKEKRISQHFTFKEAVHDDLQLVPSYQEGYTVPQPEREIASVPAQKNTDT